MAFITQRLVGSRVLPILLVLSLSTGIWAIVEHDRERPDPAFATGALRYRQSFGEFSLLVTEPAELHSIAHFAPSILQNHVGVLTSLSAKGPSYPEFCRIFDQVFDELARAGTPFVISSSSLEYLSLADDGLLNRLVGEHLEQEYLQEPIFMGEFHAIRLARR